MKKHIIMIITILICFILLFCLSFNIRFSGHVPKVESNSSPLSGTWIAKKYFCLENSSLSDKDAKVLLGSTLVFSKDKIYVNDTPCTALNYKVKLVSSTDYLWDNYRIKPSDIGVTSTTIKIYTVSSLNVFLDDYIEIDKNCLARSFNGVLLLYNKLGSSSEIGNDILSKTSKITLSKEQEDIISETGLILGLRYKENNIYRYKTLFVSSNYNNFSKIIIVNDLIVPRKNGFWKISLNNSSSNNLSNTSIYEYPMMKYSDTPENLRKSQNIVLPANSFINFINNDYIFTDTTSAYFSVLPLDNINSSTIEFSKILGATANNFLTRSAKLFLTQKEKKNIPEPNINTLETNWSIIRRTGKWILRGRIPSGDFDISFQIPTILTNYDSLYIPFNVIKRKYPDTTDAYASINKDFLVILSKNNLSIVPTINNIMSSPSLSTNIDETTTVIMSQWATGNYVSEWQTLFNNLSK